MNTFVLSLLASVIVSGISNAGERPDTGLVVTSASGEVLTLPDTRKLAVKFWLQQLVLSALNRGVVRDTGAEEWNRATQSPSKIHCMYAAESHIAIPERRMLTFHEIALPIAKGGYTDFIYLKHGESYLRLAKYDPWLLGKLMIEAGLASAMPERVARTLF